MLKAKLFGAVLFCFMLGQTVVSNAAVTVLWTSPVTDTGSFSDFDTGTITFAPFVSDELISMGGSLGVSQSEYHNHATGATNILDIHLDGAWTTIYSDIPGAFVDTALSSIPSISFASGTVDGLRWTVSTGVHQGYHFFNNGSFSGTTTFFTFDTSLTSDAATVPESSSVVIWAVLSVTAMGTILIRRRKINAV